MRLANLLSPSRSFKLAIVKPHNGRITTDQPDEMWGTDQTSTLTAEGQACVFIAVDHCTAECLVWGTESPSRSWSNLTAMA